jgi:hypothetical protein
MREQGKGNREQGKVEKSESQNVQIERNEAKLSVVCLQLSAGCLAATRRGARSNCGMRIQQSEPRAPATGHEASATSHSKPHLPNEPTAEPRITNHAKAQWPNKAISLQHQGRQLVSVEDGNGKGPEYRGRLRE